MNKTKLKQLSEIMIQHREADKLVQGHWRNGENGCFYGCATHSDESAIESAIEEFELPEWVAYWSEQVFEGLKKDESLDWPVQMLDALIAFNGDIEQVKHKLAIKRLTNLLPTGKSDVDDAINQVIEYHKEPNKRSAWSAESAAWSAAWAAAESAESAELAESARAAAESAESAWSAESAAWSAESAARAARAAAESAESAELAESAARSARAAAESAESAVWAAARAAKSAAWAARAAAWRNERDWFLEILKND